eukprot:15430426-Alexandrium_andersonii.AAC.1
MWNCRRKTQRRECVEFSGHRCMARGMQRRTGRNATGMCARTWGSRKAGHPRACSSTRHGGFG